MQWIHHKPQGTIDTGTVLKPKFKNGRSVKNLRSSDILRKDIAGYSVVHQDADPNGDVETSVYKGHIISTVCGGAQMIIDDIETMTQKSPPKRRRAASDAQFTH
jgi:kinesin family protein 23